MSGQTLFDRIWQAHTVAELGDGYALLHVDRHLLHDLGGGRAVMDIKEKGYTLRNPGLTFATPDHAISSAPGRAGTSATGQRLLERSPQPRARIRRAPVRCRRARPGHRPCHRPGAGAEPARAR